MRLLMAVLIVALHTSPLLDINQYASYVPSQVFSRLGVPFFAGVAGYYFFKNSSQSKYKKSLIKYAQLYLMWTAIYLLYLICTGGC